MRGLAPRRRSGRPRRRGATMVLTAVMMTTILGFVALAVDTMVLAVAKHQLSTAADAGALAGAAALADERRFAPDAPLDDIMAAAHERAELFAERNPVLGRPPVLYPNPSNSPDGDIVLGYIEHPTDPNSPFLTDPSLQPLFNSVRVRAVRSAERGGIIPAYFARAIGFEGTALGAVGTGSALVYEVDGFGSDPDTNAGLLPIVLDKNTYEDMISPSVTTTDQYRYDPITRTVSAGADGVEESQLYPVKNGYPGNWGTVKIGVSNNSTSTLGAQIRYGVTPQQLGTYPGGKLTLNQTDAQGNTYVMLGGNPGISSGIKDDLEAIIGQPRTIPIYDPAGSGGNGNNAQYKIIAFQPVRVLAVSFKGNPKYVIVQPAMINDPTAIPGDPKPNGWTSGGGLIRLHLTR
ncbi:pilus assembly protein TadG-related protein [Tautonia sociabilis]|uniref:Putative Flp pilus-assembly TadG-like N-terminal domain-containing protein n=1 Tax=Tautonia sociabilis TaxID=2080755 RepID=A0A432MHV3_9BACT|nr:pilus assembly protein TadG-related protein [Tautonia sociabilis]RUL86727.1 hypothetical protein TsocGM_15590 [Tautonia sociabilis]